MSLKKITPKDMISNPYNTETGQEPPVFVERKIEMDKFKRNLRDTKEGKPRHLAILGDYGAGKTVLLWRFENLLKKNGGIPIFVQCYTVSSFKEFYNLLLNQICQTFPKEKVKGFINRLKTVGLSAVGTGVTLGLKEKDFEPQSTLLGILKSACQTIQRRKGSRVLVFLIDDLHLVTQSLQSQILEIMRNVFTLLGREKMKAMLVVSGLPTLFPTLEKLHEAIVSFFEPQRLLYFSYGETNKAVTEPVEEYGIEWSKEAVRMIYNLSEGNPYYIQLLSYYTFEHLKGRKIDTDSVKDGVTETLEHLAATKFLNMYESTSDSEKKVLYALFELGDYSSFTQIVEKSCELGVLEGTSKKLIRRLYNKNLIEKSNGKYRLSSKLFRRWLEVEKPFLSNGTITSLQ